jgi:3-deoxy-7-phosphoheptulonate synthase
MPPSVPDVWTPNSWKAFPAEQQPTYADPLHLEQVLDQLRRFPPLVTSWEVDQLHDQLAAAQRGEAWLLQGGDCAERFEDCEAESIASKLKVLLQMSLVLVFQSRTRVIRLGRLAGQYAKPRSSPTETVEGVTLPCYRGDLINASRFEPGARRADPLRLLRGYERSALTLNFVRGLSAGGFADLHHPENWNLLFDPHGPRSEDYQRLVGALREALAFMETISSTAREELKRIDFFTSHEALHLDYETALTRHSVRGVGFYNLSTHLPWIGDRTRQLDGAHVEYMRGIRNPVGVKIGPSLEPDQLLELIDRLNPDRLPGRVTLIHRFGRGNIERFLPPMVEAVKRHGPPVLWVCDPMHGNTVVTQTGHKTRRLDDVLDELALAFAIHHRLGSRLGGVHLELTGENVTECVGGAAGLSETDLHSAYHTGLDPRLNYDQAMEIAFALADHLRPTATAL